MRIEVGHRIDLGPVATSMIFYIIRGSGTMSQAATRLGWAEGDFFSAPALDGIGLVVPAEAALYYVDDAAADRNRVNVLLANENFPQSRTVTHMLGAMYDMIGAGTEQKPQRHQSIALDYIVDCNEGVYSLIGSDLDHDRCIKNPERVDWIPNCSFVISPDYWNAHSTARHAMPA